MTAKFISQLSDTADFHPHARPQNATAHLRILSTTDLHAHLFPYDYHSDTDDQPFGLTRVATLIRAARAEAANVMLFDSGDALQGTPLGDLSAPQSPKWVGPNPILAAMNMLRYDAATVGNHEFSFGLDWLSRTLKDADFPYTCANLMMLEDATPARTYLPPYLLLRRMIRDDAHVARPLTIGVIGVVPPQIMTWDHAHLSGRLHAEDMIQAARQLVPKIRAAGADIVLMLAHSGIDTSPRRPMMENAALSLAAIEGVDAIMAGHSHEIFPHPGAPKIPGVDHLCGLLSGKPAVMAGARGSHLGVLDLALELRDGRWRIIEHNAEVRAVAPLPGREQPGAHVDPVPCDRELARALTPAHRLTQCHMRRPIGRAVMRLHSYLAMARPDPSIAAVNKIKSRLLARALQGGAYEGIPILSATPPYKTGGHGGPGHFTDLPKGVLSLRHAADLYPFPNHLCGLLMNGAELREWLERAAICFATIRHGQAEGMLCDNAVPGHDFDVISGLTYRINLSQPPRYDRRGARTASATRRIEDLRYQCQPLDDSAQFILATNSHRAYGAGAFAPLRPRIVHFSQALLRDELVREIADTPLAPPQNYTETWRFMPLPGASALLDTGPGLRSGPAALAELKAEVVGKTQDGFLRLRLWL